MAPRSTEVPAISQQIQANRNTKIPTVTLNINKTNNNLVENTPHFVTVQTSQQTMQTLAILTQQIAAINFNPTPPKQNWTKMKQNLYALVETILHHNDDD
ncbi:hypothetical protein TNCV_1190381 [Trichonephila clavipes]|nr:hypothetical protein TNCV_1190381 [Trichonephila clavipes]